MSKRTKRMLVIGCGVIAAILLIGVTSADAAQACANRSDAKLSGKLVAGEGFCPDGSKAKQVSRGRGVVGDGEVRVVGRKPNNAGFRTVAVSVDLDRLPPGNYRLFFNVYLPGDGCTVYALTDSKTVNNGRYRADATLQLPAGKHLVTPVVVTEDAGNVSNNVWSWQPPRTLYV